MISSLLTNLISTKQWHTDDSPQYWEGIVDNPSIFCNWKDVEHCINNPWFYDLKYVNKDDNSILEFPRFGRIWSDPPCGEQSILMDMFKDGHTLIINNAEFIHRKNQEILAEVEKYFPRVWAAMHIYCGWSASRSFNIHEDLAQNFILQIEGETHWIVYNNRSSQLMGQERQCPIPPEDMDVALDVILKPGDIIYIPARTWHCAKPASKRLSMSIPMQDIMIDMPHIRRIDRQYYELPRTS